MGQIIIDKFYNTTTDVVVLTRGEEKKNKNIRYLNWDAATLGSWSNELEGADVLINLTGKSVDCRYTEKNKKEIISSRVNATKVLAEAFSKIKTPPTLWMNASSAAIYKHSEEKEVNDYYTEYENGFSAEVCKQWEKAFNEANVPNTRKVTLRISLVIGKSGGVWPVLSKLVKFGLGGKMGNGKQYISWIHETDFLKAVVWFIENEKAKGAYTIAAPNPLMNKDFMKLMREKWNVIFGLPATAWMLEIGAFFIRTETELILKSRRVVSKRLSDEGFQFNFSDAESAMNDLIK